MTSGIYKITNIESGRIYIGSSKRIEIRKLEHFNALENNTHPNPILQKSFNKHGKENFIFEIIEETNPEKKILLEREQYWIDYLKSYDLSSGFNISRKATGGFEKGCKSWRKNLTKENEYRILKGSQNESKTKKELFKTGKLIIWNKGLTKDDPRIKNISEKMKIFSNKDDSINKMKNRIISSETRLKLSESKKGEKNPFYGKHLSDEHKSKMSNSLKGKNSGKNNPMYNQENIEKMKESIRKISSNWSGDNNPAKRNEVREKIRQSALNRKKKYREDGTWYWEKKDDILLIK